MPSSLLITIAMAFIMKCAQPKWMKIVASVGCIGAGAYFGDWFGGRLFENDEFRDVFGIIFGIGFALTVNFVMHFITIPDEARKPLLIIAFGFTSLVAFTRLVMGAHYLSDVTVGGTISFSCTLLGIAVYEKIRGKFGV